MTDACSILITVFDGPDQDMSPVEHIVVSFKTPVSVQLMEFSRRYSVVLKSSTLSTAAREFTYFRRMLFVPKAPVTAVR